ncbi:MAG: DUF4956 domain-containing protein [Clostridia bacterium]
MNDITQGFNLQDVFKSSVGLPTLLLTLGMAIVVGIFVFFIYRKTFGGVMYSRNLNMSFVLLTVVTSLMLMLINNNLTLSLGMVGALSIIRFRTAVKDPMDTVFMFWAVGEGIAVGTHFFFEAIIAAIVIGVVLVVMNLFKSKVSMPYLLIIHYDERASQTIKQAIKQLPNSRLKSKVVQRDGVELTLEIRLKSDETGFVEKLMRLEGVFDATLITHQGDIVA